MGKIRVSDLATKMKVPEQDLVFKLKSIGVRVDGDDATIDSEIIQAILQGKNLPQSPQREVIMRDKQSGQAPAPPRKRPPAPRRQPTGPLRPNRRRTVVQKADPKIRTIPTSERRPKRTQTPEEIAIQEMAAEEARKESLTQEAAPEAVETKAEAPRDETKAADTAQTPEETREEAAAAQAASDVSDEQPPAEPEPTTAPEPEVTAPKKRRRQGHELRPAEDLITIAEGIRVRDLAEKLGVRAKDLIKTLMSHGVMASVNHTLSPEVAKQVAEELGHEVMLVSFEEEVQLEHEKREEVSGPESRSPVVTVMGHVDHGKTSLLDRIRSSSLTEAEHGGITQHIAAYKVEPESGEPVVFLDTPGHEAFTQLRARGAQATDIVVLVVAADDGVMPQTVEAIQHARAAEVPMIVAINKVDRPNANIDRVKQQLSEHELLVEDWGGDIVSAEISALKGDGVPELMELIQLTAELAELKADSKVPAQGVVIEARKEAGRGNIATVLVQTGTLRTGDAFVTGATWGRVRSMTDDRGQRIEEAGPSTPVEVAGFNEVPDAGDVLQAVEKESKARDIASLRQDEKRQRDLAPTAGRMSLESLFSQMQEGEVKELPLVVKADVQGSIDVLKDTLTKLSTDKVKVKIIGSGVGGISTNDVLLASASNAIIVGFNVRPEKNATDLAGQEEVEIRSYTIIYELTDEIRQAMAGLLEPTYREVEQGRAEVRETFKVPRIGVVAGCHVVEGVIPRSAGVRLVRDNIVIYEGSIASLRRFKDDAAEVRSGFDCGIGLERFQDVKPGDTIEAFTQEEVRPSL